MEAVRYLKFKRLDPMSNLDNLVPRALFPAFGFPKEEVEI